ncbi:Glutamate receptor 2.9, partial [Linum perenne]
INSISPAVAQNSNAARVEVNIGVILDLNITNFVGQMGLSCAQMAASEFYASHPNYTTRIIMNTRNSRGDVVTAAASVG